MFDKKEIIDLFRRQWHRVDRSDIDKMIGDTGGISAFECVLMYLFILDRAPRWIVEFSPNHGYSTQAIAMALRVLGIKNRFGTFEIKPVLCERTNKRLDSIGLSDYCEVIQGNALIKIPEWINHNGAKVDFCFIDSDHTEGFARKYINEIFPLLDPRCLMGVHDICSTQRHDSGIMKFKTSLGKGHKKSGEEGPINEYLNGKDFCVLHAITGGKHEQANLPNNDPFYNEIMDITEVNFRKVKCAACPKTVYFINHSEPRSSKIIKPKSLQKNNDNKHVFILGMNDSGTTFVQNALSHCCNCVSFREKKQRPHGMEGQGVSYWKRKQKNWYPRDIDHGVVKVFSEKREIWEDRKHFNWGEIKKTWNEAWRKNEHFNSASPKIFIEKTPSSLFSVPMYEEHFPDCVFLIIQRNPYVVCEGIKRTVKQHKKRDYALARCARHWVACTQQQVENIQRLTTEGRAIYFKYEDMVTKPVKVAKRIMSFVPELHDIDFRKPATCHSIDGNKPQPIKNYNNVQLKRLTESDYTEINSVLDNHQDLLNFFKYTRRTQAPR